MSERTPVLSVSIKDCDVQTKRGSGKGGQNRNVRDTAVRIVHRPSGAVGESEEERSQLQNKRAAFLRMAQTPLFKAWVVRVTDTGPSPEERVEADMAPGNLRVEVRGEYGWEMAK